MIVRFDFTDWVYGMGLQSTFILIGILALVPVVMPMLLMIYGKRARVKTGDKYKQFWSRQLVDRRD
jgi:hypothetical protein